MRGWSCETTEYIIVIGNFPGSSAQCPAGTYLDDKASRCIKCPENMITEKEGATSCTPCPLGHIANEERIQCGNYFILGHIKHFHHCFIRSC